MLIKTLSNCLKKIEELNNFVDKTIIPQKILQEEHENINDLSQLKKELNKEIKKMHLMILSNKKNIPEELCLIHSHLITIIWHINQIQDLIELIIGSYRKAINYKEEQQ